MSTKLPTISREEFAALLRSGRKLTYATLYERQDFQVNLGKNLTRPVRDVSDEQNHWHRAIKV